MSDKYERVFVQIGLNILYYRKKQGYTQQALAEKIGYSKNHMQQIETAKATPSVVALLEIAEALELPIGNLFESRSP